MPVIPVVIGHLGCVTSDFRKWTERLGIQLAVPLVQKTALLGMAWNGLDTEESARELIGKEKVKQRNFGHLL